MEVKKYELSLLQYVTLEREVLRYALVLLLCVDDDRIQNREVCVSHAFWTRVWRRESQRRDVYTSLISLSKKFSTPIHHHDFMILLSELFHFIIHPTKRVKKRERYSHQYMRMIMISNY